MQAGFTPGQVQISGPECGSQVFYTEPTDSDLIGVSDGCKAMTKEDSDFDPIRDEPAFQAFIGR
jgi:hypothetical protein